MQTEKELRELKRTAKQMMLNGRLKSYLDTLMRLHTMDTGRLRSGQ